MFISYILCENILNPSIKLPKTLTFTLKAQFSQDFYKLDQKSKLLMKRKVETGILIFTLHQGPM